MSALTDIRIAKGDVDVNDLRAINLIERASQQYAVDATHVGGPFD